MDLDFSVQFKWRELYLFAKSYSQVNLGLKEHIYDRFNYIKVECPVWVVLRRLRHNLLELLLKEFIWAIKSFEQDDFSGFYQTEDSGVSCSRPVLLILMSPLSPFIFAITLPDYWFEFAVNLTVKVFYIYMQMLNWHIFLEPYFSELCIIILNSWKLKIPGVLFSTLSMFIHILWHQISMIYILV